MNCLPPSSIPDNSIMIDSKVTAYYNDLSGWTRPECPWECSQGFIEQDGECVEEKNHYNEYNAE